MYISHSISHNLNATPTVFLFFFIFLQAHSACGKFRVAKQECHKWSPDVNG
jgi:hypothetical protein